MLSVAHCHADVDEQSKREIKDILLNYDRTLLVADPRRCEPKKYASNLLKYDTSPEHLQDMLLG